MHEHVGREREMVPGEWVHDLLHSKGMDAVEVAVLAKKSPSTVYGWQRRGIEYLDWIGLLTLLDEEPTWRPESTSKKKAQ